MSDPKLRATIEKSNATKARLMVEGKLNLKTRGRGSHFESVKLNKTIWCRSTFERAYVELLEENPLVSTYKVEPFCVPYVWDGSVRRYFPDFLVTHVDGSKLLVEVKPNKLTTLPKNVVKFESARAWCAENDAVFQIVTEVELGL